MQKNHQKVLQTAGAGTKSLGSIFWGTSCTTSTSFMLNMLNFLVVSRYEHAVITVPVWGHPVIISR